MSIYDVNGSEIVSDVDVKNVLPNEIVVAAYDTPAQYKKTANYICDGSHDEVEIQNAINDVNTIGYGTVRLLGGTYNIDAFASYSSSVAERSTALLIGANTTIINIKGSTGDRETLINVTNSALSGILNQVAVFASSKKALNTLNNFVANFSDFRLNIADLNHAVIGIDNFFTGASQIENVRIRQLGFGAGIMPAQNSVGIRCTNGNPNGIGQVMKNVGCTGFYEGFQMGGEHLVAIECLAHNCYYGYTFGNYPYTVGVAEHPLTLINCADELSASLPLFNRCGDYSQSNKYGKQAVSMIDFTIELRPTQNPTQSAVLPAEEVTEGAWCGNITFAANDQPRSYYNIPNLQFWKAGSGLNFKTVNSVHRLGGTTAERNTYTPQYMQQYFDTTLNKMLIYDGSVWKDMDGTPV